MSHFRAISSDVTPFTNIVLSRESRTRGLIIKWEKQ